ncbi:MAG: ABC transporter ATP-binding protein [Chloroflexota bacterium]
MSVEGLTRRFGPVTAVDNLSLYLSPGEIYGLVGPDGAGKTTTFRLLCGVLRPDAGHGTIAGYDLRTGIDRAREQIGYLPQRFSLYTDLTVAENLRFFAQVNGLPAGQWQPRQRELLQFVGLDEFANRLAGQLSGGMKQKLGLATALIHRPRLLLLDEPTGGVDPVTRQDFWQLIIRVVGQEGVAVVVSTPYMDEAARCTRVGFLHNGRLLIEGTPRQLTRRLDGRILELIGSPRALLRQTAQADPDVEEVHAFGSKLHLRVRPGAAGRVLERLPQTLATAGALVERLRPIPPTLEDTFIELL